MSSEILCLAFFLRLLESFSGHLSGAHSEPGPVQDVDSVALAGQGALHGTPHPYPLPCSETKTAAPTPLLSGKCGLVVKARRCIHGKTNQTYLGEETELKCSPSLLAVHIWLTQFGGAARCAVPRLGKESCLPQLYLPFKTLSLLFETNRNEDIHKIHRRKRLKQNTQT